MLILYLVKGFEGYVLSRDSFFNKDRKSYANERELLVSFKEIDNRSWGLNISDRVGNEDAKTLAQMLNLENFRRLQKIEHKGKNLFLKPNF